MKRNIISRDLVIFFINLKCLSKVLDCLYYQESLHLKRPQNIFESGPKFVLDKLFSSLVNKEAFLVPCVPNNAHTERKAISASPPLAFYQNLGPFLAREFN